jgi:hypothetical protein
VVQCYAGASPSQSNMNVSTTESMRASASSSLAAGIVPAAAITDRLTPRCPTRRWMFLPKDAEGVGACDEEGGERANLKHRGCLLRFCLVDVQARDPHVFF